MNRSSVFATGHAPPFPHAAPLAMTQLPLPFKSDAPAMRLLATRVEEARHSDVPVLLCGEPGSGRELLARTIHETGPRHAREFLALDGSATPSSLAPLANAAGGTFLVRELSTLSRPAQTRLTKILRRRAGGAGGRDTPSDRDPDVRCIGSTDTDLGQLVADGIFDRELYDRLGQHTIEIPPLRKRANDVPLLADAFARQIAAELGRGKIRICPAAHDRLRQYPWPGNQGELREVVRRLVLRARGGEVTLPDVEEVLPDCAERVPLEQIAFEEMVRAKIGTFLKQMKDLPVEDLYGVVIARVERPLLEVVLSRTGGNEPRAARMLGVSLATLRRKLATHGLRSSRPRPSRPKSRPQGA